jgi:2,7-dihydroxy-5-methyl-1-naphthoate 7-O-methyltransferase
MFQNKENMANEMSKMFDLGNLYTPWCLHVISTLNIADHINSGINTLEDLAIKTNCQPHVLKYLLRTLVDKGLFSEPQKDHYELTDLGNHLLDPTIKLMFNLEGIAGRFAEIWSTLLIYLRTGKSTYKDRFGVKFWEDLEKNEKVGRSFDELMGPIGHGTPKTNIDITDGWENVSSVVDVGGGKGDLLAEILKTYNHISGKLVDLPRTVKIAEKVFLEAAVTDRIEIIGQSFFEPLPSGSDIYILKKIITNWPDDEVKDILTLCQRAAYPNGRIIIIGGVSDGDTMRYLPIEMILIDGKYRTLEEFKQLAKECKLEVIRHSEQEIGDVTECRVID